MPDSEALMAWIDDMTDEEYAECKFPIKGADSKNELHSDFGDEYPISPLTGAGFKVTPIGFHPIDSKLPDHSLKKRFEHGRIAGYLVEMNPPACTVGHNRELVNGVAAGARIALAHLKYWQAVNGCTRKGLDAIKEDNVVLQSATPTYLFMHLTEEDARYSLAQFRSRSEILLNKSGAHNSGKAKKKAYSFPPKTPERGEYTYTSYIRQRDHLIDCYVKVPDVDKAVCKPVTDPNTELVFRGRAKRILRVGVKVTAKWLLDNGLSRIADWVGNDDGYAKAFALIRADLRLDDKLRSKQFRMPSITSLDLRPAEKNVLRWHLKGNEALDHEHFRMMPSSRVSKAYSAMKIRIFRRTHGIDLDLPYEAQKKLLYPELENLLVYPGEYKPPADLEPYMFSRVSAPLALKRLAELTELELVKGESPKPAWPFPAWPNAPKSAPNPLWFLKDAPLGAILPE